MQKGRTNRADSIEEVSNRFIITTQVIICVVFSMGLLIAFHFLQEREQPIHYDQIDPEKIEEYEVVT